MSLRLIISAASASHHKKGQGGTVMEMQTTLLENKHLLDFNPVEFGQQQCDPLYSFRYKNIQNYLIHYVVSGKGTLYKNDVKYEVCEGEAFLIKKNETTHYIADKKDPWHYIWVVFNGNLAEKFKELDDVFRAPGKIFEKMLHVLEPVNMKEEYLASQLFALYIYLFGEQNSSENYVNKVKNFIDLKYMENIKISDIAKLLNINRKYLARLFKEETGITMKEYLTKAKMTRAAELLAEGCTVSETAEILSYSDQSLFSTSFYKFYGKYPSAMRKHSAKEQP